jgi:hypothetical protein
MSLRVFHPGTPLLYQEAFSEADCEFTCCSAVAMSGLGQGRAWLLRAWHARCTPDTCRSKVCEQKIPTRSPHLRGRVARAGW